MIRSMDGENLLGKVLSELAKKIHNEPLHNTSLQNTSLQNTLETKTPENTLSYNLANLTRNIRNNDKKVSKEIIKRYILDPVSVSRVINASSSEISDRYKQLLNYSENFSFIHSAKNLLKRISEKNKSIDRFDIALDKFSEYFEKYKPEEEVKTVSRNYKIHIDAIKKYI